MKLLTALFLLLALPVFGAVPAYTSFKGTAGIIITTNPPTGDVLVSGAGVFTSSGTNATIATSKDGVLIAVASTNINFVTGSNVFLATTNSASTTHIGINAFTPVPFIEGAVSNYLLTYILPVLAVDTLTVSNLLVAPPNASVQYNSNGIMRGSAGFIYTNGQVRVADIVVAGQGIEITANSLVLNGGPTALLSWTGLGNLRWPSSGVARFEDEFSLNMNRIQLGGDTAAFPAIGRTNGDVIILGANGKFKAGDSTNKLRAPAVFIANDSGMGTPLLRLENPLNALGWDLAINSNPETFLLGLGPVDENYVMVLERTSGNVGIGITNPTVRLDVQGRFMARSNVYFPNISSNATPVAFLATDSNGEVYETAVPTGGGAGGAGSFAVNPNQFVTNSQLNFKDGALTTNLNVKATQGSAIALTVDTNVLVVNTGKVGIGTDSPLYPLDISAATGRQRISSTTAANGSQLLFVNNSEGLIGLESSGAGTTVAGSSEYSLLVANQYAYPVQLATDNTVRMTVLPTSGNVGIVTGSPTNALDVSGHASIRSNLFLANLPTNGSPIAFLATDAAGVVYETAVPAGGGGGSLTTNANQFGASVQLSIKSGALVTNLAIYGSTNLGHVLFSPDNTYDIGASGATRPRSLFVGSDATIGTTLTVAGNILGGNNIRAGGSGEIYWLGRSHIFSPANGVITLYDDANASWNRLQLGGTTAAFPALGRTNGDLVVFGANGAFDGSSTNRLHVPGGIVLTNANVAAGKVWTAVGALGGGTWSNAPAGSDFHAWASNSIPFMNQAGNALVYYNPGNSLSNGGFGFHPSGPHGGGAYGGLRVFADYSHGLVTIGHPNPGSAFATFVTALAVTNAYAGTGFKQEMSRYDATDVSEGSDPSSTFVTYRTWSGGTPTIAAEVRKDGMGFFSHGTMYQSNALAVAAMPTAAELGPGGYWVGVSNTSLVSIYSANGSSTAMKVLAP